WTTGPHLHYQVEKGNSPDITNRNTIDPEKFLAGNGGGSKSASKWRSDIIRAARSMKVNLSNTNIKDIIRLIDTESSGNAGVTQHGYTDVNTGGNEARGLLQYTPGTWKGYKTKSGGNILNGFHQLKAFFNNSNWRRDLSSWKSRMSRGQTGWGPTGSNRGFATGGIIRENGFYNLTEEGHEEVVIPTDPKRSSDAMKLISYVANKVQGKPTRNKRPNQISNQGLPNQSSYNNNEVISIMTEQIQKQDKQIELLTKLVLSTQNIEKQPKGYSEKDLSKAQGRRAEMLAWSLGGSI
ncbi:MAG TPA: phage tail tape measure protein, partial [Candidatus Coprovivens excrementavium]|nr:phage tail tape measure protein [Candidatus Coprovivens excrementavium]